MKKRVHWQKDIPDYSDYSKKKKVSSSPKSRIFGQEEIEEFQKLFDNHFEAKTFGELEILLNGYSKKEVIDILSIDDYYPFREAARNGNIEALKFIISKVPSRVTYKMAHYSEPSEKFMAFKFFFLNQMEICRGETLDRKQNFEGLKLFLEIDDEAFCEFFNELIDAYLPINRHTESPHYPRRCEIRKILKEDFDAAIKQLQEENTVDIKEESYSPKANVISDDVSNKENEGKSHLEGNIITNQTLNKYLSSSTSSNSAHHYNSVLDSSEKYNQLKPLDVTPPSFTKNNEKNLDSMTKSYSEKELEKKGKKNNGEIGLEI